MSETMPERPQASSGPNFLTRMIGPLPVWAWLGLVLVGGVLYYFWQKNQSNSSSSSTDTGTTSTSDIPQFVNQVYTNGEPPSDGNHGPAKKPTTSEEEYSWKDEGQKWTIDKLASELKISPDALGARNTQAKDVLEAYKKGNRKKLIPKGAEFTYTKAPKTRTT